MKVGFVSLGCSKNLVDTEKTIDIFKKHGYDIVNNPKEAEMLYSVPPSIQIQAEKTEK